MFSVSSCLFLFSSTIFRTFFTLLLAIKWLILIHLSVNLLFCASLHKRLIWNDLMLILVWRSSCLQFFLVASWRTPVTNRPKFSGIAKILSSGYIPMFSVLLYPKDLFCRMYVVYCQMCRYLTSFYRLMCRTGGFENSWRRESSGSWRKLINTRKMRDPVTGTVCLIFIPR